MVGKQRNFGLDIIRAVSILLVLFAHRFDHKYEFGVVGVQIFFILSGFLIGQILINDYKNGADLSTITKFWKRRWFRTLPLYYLVLTLKIFIFGNPLGWKIIVYYFFLQANLVGIDFFPVSWSLVVEEWFYLFLPIALILFFNKGIESRKLLFYLFALIVFFFVSRFLWNYLHKGIIIYQFDCLLLGVIIAAIKLYYTNIYSRLNCLPVFLTGLSGILFFTWVLGDMRNIPVYSPFYRVTWYFLISIFITFIIPYAERSVFINETLRKIKPLYYFFTWTSILTYSMYLIHGEIFHFRIDAPDYVNVIMHAMLLYGLSFLFYSLYEHPMMSLRDKFSLKQYIVSLGALYNYRKNEH